MRNTIRLFSLCVFFVAVESFAGKPPGYASLASVVPKTGNVLLAKVESSTESRNNANGRILQLVIEIEDGLVGLPPTVKTLKCRYEEYQPSLPAHPHQVPVFIDYTGSGNEFALKKGRTYIFLLAALPTDKTEAKLLRVEPIENKGKILTIYRERVGITH